MPEFTLMLVDDHEIVRKGSAQNTKFRIAMRDHRRMRGWPRSCGDGGGTAA